MMMGLLVAGLNASHLTADSLTPPCRPPSTLHYPPEQEAAMMASLRHPSIVMYLGVCLDPPAVVTEYCARGG